MWRGAVPAVVSSRHPMYTESAGYQIVIFAHSWLRWAVLLSGCGVVGIAITRWRTRREWDVVAQRWALAFLISSAALTVTGFFLYFFITPWVSALVSFPSQVVGARGMRFWAVDHTAATVASMALTYFGWLRIANAAAGAKARVASLWFGAAMLLILLSMPWPFLKFGRPLFRF